MRYRKMISIVVAASALIGVVFAQTPASTGDAAPATIQPQPSEMMPNAPQSLLLDVVDTGFQLVAVGSRGHILQSADGVHWKQIASPVRSTLTSVNFVDGQNGWAVGHDAVILHTDTGGGTWDLQNFQPDLEKPLLDVLFLDTSHGFVVGAYGLFLQTEDGGSHWNPVAAPAILEGGLHLYAIRKLGNGDLLIAGEQGLVGLSTDGGKTWAKLSTGYAGTFFSAASVGSSGVVLCGLRGNAYFASDLRNPVWQKINTATVDSMYGCATAADGSIVMGGVNGTLLSVDPQTLKVTRLADPISSALSGVLPWRGGLVLVGESGVSKIDMAR